MSNDGVGKIKQKRKNVPSKPYARGQSFFGKFKDTVKEILQPSWLGSIVSSLTRARSESAPSTPMPPQVKPDSQFSSSTPRRNAYPLNSLHQQNRGVPTPNMYSAVDGHMPYVSYVPNNNQPSTSSQGPRYDNEINISDYSFSGGLTSSMPAPSDQQDESVSLDDSRLRDQPEQREKPRQHEEESRVRSTPDPDTSVLSQKNESSSFFGKPSKRPRTTGPQFNISLFTTPRPSHGCTMFGNSFQQSPYYPGKTTYGGAASHRKLRLKASVPYQSNLSVNKVTPRPLNKSSGGTVTSSTARKILDALESMPSVLHDAKRIPINKSSLYDSPLSFTPRSYPRRQSLQANRSRLGTPAGAPPTSRVNALGRASIAQNRQYLLPMREQPPPETSQAEKVVPASAPPVSHVETPQHSSGKMKRDKSHHYQTRKDDDDEVAEIPNLPTKFVLPSDGFKLDIAVKAPQPKSKSSGPTPEFTFSSPIQKISTPITSTPGAAPGFQFSSPISIDEQRKEATSLTNKNLMPEISFGNSSGLKLKTKPPKEVAPVSSFAPASELKQGSVLDILGKGSAFSSGSKTSAVNDSKTQSSVTSVNSFLDKLKPAAGSWECSTCMVNNKSDVSKCVACMTSKPSERKESFKGLLAPHAAGSWDCPICMINNKAERSTCAACQARKPEPVSKKAASIMTGSSGGWDCPVCLLINTADRNSCLACTAPKPAKKLPAPKAIVPDKDIVEKLKPPEDSWSCPTCMVSNKSDADSCICCSTANPKPKNSGSSGSSVSGKTDQSLYENLKRPAGNWECPVCMISNKADASSCLACSSPNPTKSNNASTKESPHALAKLKRPAVADAWTCDTCLVSNGPTALKCIACETPKPGATKPSGFAQPGGFPFGNSGSGFVIGSKTSASALFAFGGASKNDTDSTPKTSDSASVGFKFGATDSSSTGGFKISSTVSGSAGAFKFGDGNNEKKDSTSSAGITFGAKTSEAKSESKSDSVTGGFKFGGDSNKDTGFKFGEQTSDSKDTKKTIGGFAFNAGNSDSSIKTSALAGVLSNSNKSDPASLGGGSKTTNTSSAAGGFTFGGSTKRKADNEENDEVKKVPEFLFGAPLTSVPTLSQPKQDTAEPKKENGSIGGFAFKPIATATSTPSTAGFGAGVVDSKSFAFQASQSSIKTVQSLFGSSENEPPAKRKHADGLTGGSGAKSGFNFGSQSSTPSFGQSNSTSSTPTFGQSTTNPTTSAAFTFGGSANPSPAASSTVTFNFGAPVTTSANTGFGFGQPASSAVPATTSTPASTGGFNFNQNATKPSANSSFSFGQTAATSAAPGGFAFGQNTSGTAQPASTASTFTFGATATTKAQTFGGFSAVPAQPAAAPAFGATAAPAFGQQQSSTPMPFGTPNTTTPFGGQQAAPAFGATAPGPAPAFGSAAPAVPAFGVTATKTPTAAPAFGAGSTGFGATPASAFGAPATTATSSGFNFSQSAQTGTFNFAAQQQQATSAPFQFGANKPTQPTPAASQPTANPGFNFNATPNMNFGAPAAPATPQGFQFGAAPSASTTDSNPFSVTATPNIAGRKIKRASRKLKGR